MKQEEYNNYKLGALKRKFKTGRADQAPGTFIKLAQAQKETVAEVKKLPTDTKVSIMGAM